MIDPLSEVFEAARSRGRAALVGYLPVGFPTVSASVAALKAIADQGADIVEVGLPEHEAVLDGPVIRAAHRTALRAGTGPSDLLDALASLSRAGVPAVCVAYWSAITRYGADRFADGLADAGCAGLLCPDLPQGAQERWVARAAARGLGTVPLAPHGITGGRLAELAALGSGFVYATAGRGPTGAATLVHGLARSHVERVRTAVRLPVCAGIGISDSVHAARAARYADAVAVGTAFVRRLAEAPGEREGIEAVGGLARDLARAMAVRHAIGTG
ncbi:tryptophan synthase subunit alpha [Streptomyces sp. 4F14]|uniref:tryptophan synthase subunit alpha n=1 Tax=Streptomyces sp. 4F14 TaxID=3394380 RepID=UPI003A89D55B